jgi:hypothetical protein
LREENPPRRTRKARKAGKVSGSQTEPITISLRLCAFARRKKKKNMARKDAKPQRPSAGGQVSLDLKELQLCYFFNYWVYSCSQN